ncbi:hypothetical protein AMJ57_02375 [Parcubacteria bacterium SG8_24]|nr:MAG: hypothetical protein AMJ57_02375 [Parcubacteria bacterium SG8_24]
MAKKSGGSRPQGKFASVIPAVRLPRKMSAFDYAIPDRLTDAVRRGAWVLIPWRGRLVDGLVVGINPEPEIPADRLKEISGLGSTFVLPEGLVDSLLWCSGHYLVSPGAVVQAFLPKTPKRKRLEVPDGTAVSPPPHAGHPDTAKRTVRYRSCREKLELTAQAVTACLKSGRTALVIVPHIEEVRLVTDGLRPAVDESQIAELHGQLSAGKLWQVWQRILEGSPLVVVGTRLAVAAPAPYLGMILIQESDSPDHKQYDQNPRYDARTLAARRAETDGAGLWLMSQAPRVEDLHLTGSRADSLRPSGPDGEAPVTLVDASGLRPAVDQEILPPLLQEALAESLQKSKKALIFLNRRGSAAALVCRDCGHVFRCTGCETAQAVSGPSLVCRRCGVEADLPLTCPGCRSASLRPLGLGTASLHRLVQAAFPEVPLARVDTDSGPVPDLEKARILIGTRRLIHGIAEHGTPTGPFGSVVALGTDDLLAHPGFRVTEEAWRTVRVLRDIAAQDDGRLLVQALDPDQPRIRNLLLTPEEFLQAELQARQRAGFPPYSILLTVTAVGEDEEQAQRRSRKLKEDLIEDRADKSAELSGPLRPRQPWRHGTWRSVILIRTDRIDDRLRQHLLRLPEHYIIDRDPETIG